MTDFARLDFDGVNSAPHFTGQVKASLSVPSFYENFDVESGVLKDESLNQQLIDAVNSLK